MTIPFFKYQATGNDFVLIDNRDNRYDGLTTAQVALLCDRRFGIGGDGLMLLSNKSGYDFDMKYFNADGREGSMCGNGGRSIAQFARHLGIITDKARFTAVDGEHVATLQEDDWVRLQMNPVHEVKQEGVHFILNTGSPHYVVLVDDVDSVNVSREGAAIRYSPTYSAEGINVNFVQVKEDGGIYVRTYERGVEDETYSCGTGVTAAALVVAAAHVSAGDADLTGGKGQSVAAHPLTEQQRPKGVSVQDSPLTKVDIQTLGGDLSVEFNKRSDHDFEDIWLCGPAKLVFKGEISIEGI